MTPGEQRISTRFQSVAIRLPPDTTREIMTPRRRLQCENMCSDVGNFPGAETSERQLETSSASKIDPSSHIDTPTRIKAKYPVCAERQAGLPQRVRPRAVSAPIGSDDDKCVQLYQPRCESSPIQDMNIILKRGLGHGTNLARDIAALGGWHLGQISPAPEIFCHGWSQHGHMDDTRAGFPLSVDPARCPGIPGR